MNRVSLTVGLALMDLCWVCPWAALLGLWADPALGVAGLLSPLSVLGLLLGGAWTTHVLGRRARSNRGARFGLAALGALAAILAVRVSLYTTSVGAEWVAPVLGALAVTVGQISPTVLAFALGLYLWWRGVATGAQTPGFTEVEGAFRWGIGRLAVFGLVMALTTRPNVLPSVEAQTTPFVVGFFFVSLLTLALGRLESLRTRTRSPTLNSQWLAVLTLVAGGVVLVALLLGQLVSFDFLLVATRPLFDLLGMLLTLLIYAIVIPLAFVIDWLIYLVLSIVHLGGDGQPPQPLQPTQVDNILQRFFAEQVPPELLLALKAAGAAILLGIALLIVSRALLRWRPSSADADAANEERESLWKADRLRVVLLAWLRRLLRRGGHADNAPGVKPARPQAKPHGPLEVGSIRQMYARLLEEGEVAGVGRSAATTPLEHLPALTAALEPEQSLADLTDAYLQVRYAETEASQTRTEQLRDELDEVHAKDASG